MKSQKVKASLVFKEFEVLLEEKVQAKKLIVRDQGFGFYYPNAIAVSRIKSQLLRREVKLDFDHREV